MPPSMHESLKDALLSSSSDKEHDGRFEDAPKLRNDSQTTLNDPTAAGEEEHLLEKVRNTRRARSATSSSLSSNGSQPLKLKLEQSNLRKRRRRSASRRVKAPLVERVSRQSTCK